MQTSKQGWGKGAGEAGRVRKIRLHKKSCHLRADLKRFGKSAATALFKGLLGPRPGAPREVAGAIKREWPLASLPARCLLWHHPSPELLSPFSDSEYEVPPCFQHTGNAVNPSLTAPLTRTTTHRAMDGETE